MPTFDIACVATSSGQARRKSNAYFASLWVYKTVSSWTLVDLQRA